MFGLQSWRSTSDGDGGRNLVFDLAVLPQGKYVILPNQLEINLGVPLGLALDMWNEVDVNNTWVRFASGAAAGGAIEGDTAVGFVLGLMLGALGLLIDRFAGYAMDARLESETRRIDNEWLLLDRPNLSLHRFGTG